MAKKVQAMIKLQIPCGKANPAPPIGPALGQQGVNIMDFCKRFNAESVTMYKDGTRVSVEITVFVDKSFEFKIKSPPATEMIKEAAGVTKGSPNPKQIVGKVTTKQLAEIVAVKKADLTAIDLDAAIRTIAGSARSMGIEVVEDDK